MGPRDHGRTGAWASRQGTSSRVLEASHKDWWWGRSADRERHGSRPASLGECPVSGGGAGQGRPGPLFPYHPLNQTLSAVRLGGGAVSTGVSWCRCCVCDARLGTCYLLDSPGEWKQGDPGPVPPPLTVLRLLPQLRHNQEELSEGSSGSPMASRRRNGSPHKHPESKQQMRANVVQEIMDTERVYIKHPPGTSARWAWASPQRRVPVSSRGSFCSVALPYPR